MSVDDLFPVELVGGPHDGEKVPAYAGVMFLYLLRDGVEYTYGLGDDGKYHYCPEIEG